MDSGSSSRLDFERFNVCNVDDKETWNRDARGAILITTTRVEDDIFICVRYLYNKKLIKIQKHTFPFNLQI